MAANFTINALATANTKAGLDILFLGLDGLVCLSINAYNRKSQRINLLTGNDIACTHEKHENTGCHENQKRNRGNKTGPNAKISKTHGLILLE